MRISYNRLNNFEQCALKYRYAYIERLPRPPIAWLAFQRRMHKALQMYHTLARADGTINVDELLRAYDALCPHEKDPAYRESDEYQDGEEILRLYAEQEARRARVPLFLELKFDVWFGPYRLVGKIDRVDAEDDDRYSIDDYKLDRKLPPANPAAVSKQLSLYQLGLYEDKGVFADRVSLRYLRHGVEKAAPRSREDMARTVEWIDRTAKKIRDERKWAPTEGDGCGTCSFRNQCPAKTGISREAVGVWQQQSLFDDE